MRNDTENIYQQKANQALDYISANLHKPLQLDVMTAQLHVSQRQLFRILRSFLNEPLAAYIARQRVERAVMYLQTEEMTLTTLAEKVGYDNPQSFSKAFKKQFGISPKAYMGELHRRLEENVKSKDNARDTVLPEICRENAVDLVYIRILGKYGEAEPYDAAWSKLIRFLRANDALNDTTRFIGISFDDPNITNPERCRFYACASVQRKITLAGEFGTIQLRQGKYAVYTLKGSYSELQDLYNSISVNFEYTLRHGIAFEEYLNSPHNTKEEELLTKIFIPIQ
jgi:DNA gyrase inhibitor GyrI/AraC-like DNA-binding protein